MDQCGWWSYEFTCIFQFMVLFFRTVPVVFETSDFRRTPSHPDDKIKFGVSRFRDASRVLFHSWSVTKFTQIALRNCLKDWSLNIHCSNNINDYQEAHYLRNLVIHSFNSFHSQGPGEVTRISCKYTFKYYAEFH